MILNYNQYGFNISDDKITIKQGYCNLRAICINCLLTVCIQVNSFLIDFRCPAVLLDCHQTSTFTQVTLNFTTYTYSSCKVLTLFTQGTAELSGPRQPKHYTRIY